jgi:hypothetical protein
MSLFTSNLSRKNSNIALASSTDRIFALAIWMRSDSVYHKFVGADIPTRNVHANSRCYILSEMETDKKPQVLETPV